MKPEKSMISFLFILIITSFVLSACAGGNVLNTQVVKDKSQIEGTYTLILYGTAEYEGLNSIAFLDREGDDYTFVPYAPGYNFKTIKQVNAAEGIEKANSFIKRQANYRTSRIRKIVNKQDDTIGYEVRPLYDAKAYGQADVLMVTIIQEDNNDIKIIVDILPRVKKIFDGRRR